MIQEYRFPKIFWDYLISFALLVLAMGLALYLGATDADWEMVRDLRLPRVILAAGIGMGLAVSGGVLQVLFNNPLCEPYILGISSGSALGVVIGMSLGIHLNLGGLVGTSFLGALSFAIILFWISQRTFHLGSRQGQTTLLLVGVVLGFLGNGLLALWIALAEPSQLQSATVWFFGDLSRARLSGALLTFVGVGCGIALIFTQARDLDAYLLGESEAQSMGVDGARLQKIMIGLTSVLVGLCVSGGGVIGFVGLLVPHAVRFWVGTPHRNSLPLTAIWGAITLVIADLLSRWIARPYELPVGVITALIGSPVLIAVLIRRKVVIS